LPDRLNRAAATVLLAHWTELPPLEDFAQTPWKPVLAHWPACAPLLLLEVDWVEEPCSPGKPVPSDLPLSAEQASAKVRKWTEWKNRQDPRGEKILSTLWSWAANRRLPSGPPVPLVDSVVTIAAGSFAAHLELDTLDAETLFQWIQIGGVKQRLRSQCPQLWDSARRCWPIQLLLKLFPEIDFLPEVRHLTALLPLRNWLRCHLKSEDIHNARRKRFRIASIEFHAAQFNAPELWESRFSRTVLWAAFRDTPREHRTDLAPVLQAYGSTDAERAVICRTYLDEQGHWNRPEARSQIWAAYLHPVLEELPGGLGPELIVAVRSGPGGSTRIGKAGSVIARLAAAGTPNPVTYDSFEKCFSVADYFLLLLWDYLQSDPPR
jgi:hypothetical protein